MATKEITGEVTIIPEHEQLDNEVNLDSVDHDDNTYDNTNDVGHVSDSMFQQPFNSKGQAELNSDPDMKAAKKDGNDEASDNTSDEGLLDCQDENCEGATGTDTDRSSAADYFCTSCDILLCATCQFKFHQDHDLSLLSEARKTKEKYLDELLLDVNENSAKCQTQRLQLENLISYLNNSAKELMLRIESRAAKLCDQIQKRKQHLLDELRALKKYHTGQYEAQLELVDALKKDLHEASDFASTLLSHGEDTDVLALGPDVSDNLHKLLKNRGLNGVNVVSVKLDAPDETHDAAAADRLFGSLVQGVMRCGDAERLAAYNIDLPWPTGMAVTRNHDFVVTGKMGALDEKGKVMFFNKQGKVQHVENLEESCVPYGACVDPKSGDVLVTDSRCQITTYSPLGRKKRVVRDKFRGTGRATVAPAAGHLLVTSSDDRKVFLYDQLDRKYVIPSDNTQLEHPHFISTSSQGDVIVSDFKQNAVFVFDSGGKLTFSYVGNGTEGGQLKCPSAVCSDTFGNILVADFMNDRVHLVSKSGEFLGFLLTKENGVTCPNFMTLDHENNLYIGQYGGEISVFRYQSLVKYI